MNEIDKLAVAAMLANDAFHGLMQLPMDDSILTENGRALIANDPRRGVERTFELRSHHATERVKAAFLDVWVTYDSGDYGALYVIDPFDKPVLIHRKHDPRTGFTDWAKENLLHPTGHVRDTKRRFYLMGGKSPDGKRIRFEMKHTALMAWLTYEARPELTHLWVKWKDGKRHLVHRKGL